MVKIKTTVHVTAEGSDMKQVRKDVIAAVVGMPYSAQLNVNKLQFLKALMEHMREHGCPDVKLADTHKFLNQFIVD